MSEEMDLEAFLVTCQLASVEIHDMGGYYALPIESDKLWSNSANMYEDGSFKLAVYTNFANEVKSEFESLNFEVYEQGVNAYYRIFIIYGENPNASFTTLLQLDTILGG